MSKPTNSRRTIRPSTRRIPNPDEVRRAATIDRVMKADRPVILSPRPAPSPPPSPPPPAGIVALERRVSTLEAKVATLLARPQTAPVTVDEVMERALEQRLQTLAESIEDAAAQRAIAALDPRIDEVVGAKTKGRSGIDPRTLVELVDQRLKEALEARFRAMLTHLECDVIPRVLKKNASGD